MFVIEDEAHAEPQGEFDTLNGAIAELRRRAEIPWNQAPNVAPCLEWKTCGRRYEVIEYDTTQLPWQEMRRLPALDISASGATWAKGFLPDALPRGDRDCPVVRRLRMPPV